MPEPVGVVLFNRQGMPNTNTLSLVQGSSGYTETVKTDNRGGMSVLPPPVVYAYNPQGNPLEKNKARREEAERLRVMSRLPAYVVSVIKDLENKNADL